MPCSFYTSSFKYRLAGDGELLSNWHQNIYKDQINVVDNIEKLEVFADYDRTLAYTTSLTKSQHLCLIGCFWFFFFFIIIIIFFFFGGGG